MLFVLTKHGVRFWAVDHARRTGGRIYWPGLASAVVGTLAWHSATRRR